MSRKWLAILLFLSVAINVLVIGFVAGRWAFGPKEWGRHSAPFSAMGGVEGRSFFGGLDGAARDKVRERFKARAPELRALGQEARAARGAALETLAADPFDRVRAEAAMADAAAKSAAVLRAVNEIVVEIAESLTPAERAAMLQAYRERSAHAAERWRERRWGDRDEKD